MDPDSDFTVITLIPDIIHTMVLSGVMAATIPIMAQQYTMQIQLLAVLPERIVQEGVLLHPETVQM